MGNCCTCCVPKCFPCCGKKRCDGLEAQPSETAPSVLSCTHTPVGDANGAQTFQELVDCLTQQSEKKRKTNKSKRNQGSL
uniref:Uncharacterized protein n=1 Tax=Anopheles minimus TaxID=112268 RepID=A0A182WQD8_9DIPT